MYDHGLRVTNLTCIRIDPPGRTSQSKVATLSIMSPALSFCIYVIPSLRIKLVKILGVLPETWSSDLAWASVMRNWMGVHGRLWGRVTEDSREKEANHLPPINRLPAIQSLSSAPFKKGVSLPHTTFCIEITGTRRERKRERAGASGSEREREGVRRWHGLKVLVMCYSLYFQIYQKPAGHQVFEWACTKDTFLQTKTKIHNTGIKTDAFIQFNPTPT